MKRERERERERERDPKTPEISNQVWNGKGLVDESFII